MADKIKRPQVTVLLPASQLKANALIKRGSMYMQQQQSLLSTQDFNMAADMDTRNPDVYHHRGQVGAATLNSLAATHLGALS